MSGICTSSCSPARVALCSQTHRMKWLHWALPAPDLAAILQASRRLKLAACVLIAGESDRMPCQIRRARVLYTD